MTSATFIPCLNKLIDDNFQYSILNKAYKNYINLNNPNLVLEALRLAKPNIFDSLGNIQQCMPLPPEITSFTGTAKRSATPKSIISEKYKTIFDTAQQTTKFFSSGPSTLAAKLKIDLCNLLDNKGFCDAHPDWSAAGIVLCMIDAREGTTFADVPSGSCAYNTACHSSEFQNLIHDSDGSNSLAMQIAFEMC